jgi:hypothetical protein
VKGTDIQREGREREIERERERVRVGETVRVIQRESDI